MLTDIEKKEIKKAFLDNKLTITSVSKNAIVENKQIVDVLKHWVPYKKIHEITLINDKKIIVTEDHSIYTFDNCGSIIKIKPSDFPDKIIFVENDKAILLQIVLNEVIEFREYMYDLSVLDNQNFVLSSGILASNSFAPPASEGTVSGFNECRGYRWPDEQLANHLAQASNYINLFAPITCFDICNWPCLLENLLLKQAMVYAFYDMASLWIHEEFDYSVNGISLNISRSDKYINLAQAIQQQVDKQLENSKSAMQLTIRGIRQSPYTFSRGAALGPLTSGLNLNRFVR